MLSIYTDASINNDKCVATCFACTDTMFICYKSFQYHGISSSLHGELLGIRDGINYTLKHTDIRDEVSVYSDSVAAIKLIQKNEYSKRTINLRSIVDEIHDLQSMYNIKINIIQGHQLLHNPNKVVDLTSNSILRFSRR